jgi:RHS repeat-associated protein
MTQLLRVRASLYPTLIEDRFGNQVHYEWVGDQLRRIYSIDGREITIAYVAGKVSKVTAVQREWNYVYSATGYDLLTVINPDDSQWSYDFLDVKPWIQYDESTDSNGRYVNAGGNLCSPMRRMFPLTATATITHPSGAVGEFTFTQTRHGRTNVPYDCVSSADDRPPRWNAYSMFQDVQSITRKRITGLGLGEMVWSYAYAGLEGEYSERPDGVQPTPPPHYKSVTVTEPALNYVVHTFGKDYEVNEGQLFVSQTRSAAGVLAKTETTSYVSASEAAAAPFLAVMGSNYVAYADGFSSAAIRPVKSRQISQDGTTFNWLVNTSGTLAFDVFARPTSVIKSSSLGYSKVDGTAYHDNLAKWVLGQVASSTTNSITASSTTFDATTALPLKTYAFGKLQQTLTYNADGTLASVSDGRDASLDTTIFLSSWKRGIPQTITFPATPPDQPSAVNRSALVNGFGEITSVTDENGYATTYNYDDMGRLKTITYPLETEPVGNPPIWNSTTAVFDNVGAAVYGLPVNHWIRVVETGNARKIVHMDAFWRPVVEETYSVPAESATRSLTVKRYDSSGRLAFQSYPVRTLGSYTAATLKGVRTEYDALDRVTAVRQDSDGSTVLSTFTAYQSGFKTAVTNPRNKVTTTTYMAYDQPSLDWPKAIIHPAGAYTDIERDVFGKPLSVKRRNATSSEVLTRQYVYRPDWQTLCKVIEPETGATVMDYDLSGNLGWSASGLNLPAPNDCNLIEGGVANTRAQRSYDARNRLTALTFVGGNGNQTWRYWRDSLPLQVSTWNIPEAGIEPKETVNTYFYNHRRLLINETVAHPAWYTYALHYDYNANGHLSGQSYPSGHSVSYGLNALGQAVQVSSSSAGVTYASGISYYPNGAVQQFTYGNGIVHTMQQDQRQLPARSTDSKSGLTALDFGYTYDPNGNVGTITDYAQAGRQNRSMVYDDLDRLTQVTSPMFGADPVAIYTYNTLDNLTRAKVAGRDTYYCYNPENQLQFLRTGSNCSASPAHTYLDYDDQGNLESKDAALGVNLDFDFDTGNRLREVKSDGVALERYRYDAHGRRTLASRLSGPGDTLGVIFSQYGINGQLMYQENQRPGVNKEIDQIYLAGSLIAQREVSLANGAATVKYQHTDALGSPVAVTYQTGTAVERTEYEPYGKVLSPAIAKDGPGYTGHVLDAATGMNYMQQRYYDPGIGRFLSVDPVTADGSSGTNFNRYWYANNNPYRFTDPDGRCPATRRNSAGMCAGDAGASYIGNSIGGVDVNSAESIGMANIPRSWQTHGNINIGPVVAQAGPPKGSLFGDPHGEPFVPDNLLPIPSRDVLRGHRRLSDNGKVVLHLPGDAYKQIFLPSGGGYVLIRKDDILVPGRQPANGLRVQPLGTGSFSFNPLGYYEVYNSYRQAISPYSGRTMDPARAHNALLLDYYEDGR